MRDKFDILNDVKMDIDEYKEIKFDNNDEFKSKMIKKIRNRKQKNIKKIATASSVAVVGIISLGISNPDIVRAMPIIGKVIEQFDSSTFGSPVNKYVEYSQGIDISASDKDTTISLRDFIIDENIFMAGLVVKSDILSEFKGKNQRDFVNISEDIYINNKRVESIGQRAKQIDDTTGLVILTGNVSDLNIDKEAKVKINISNINQGKKELSGNWDFKFEGEKIEGSKITKLDKKHQIKNQTLIIDAIVTSPISNTIMISGIDDTKNYTLQSTKFKVLDDKGNILKSNIVDSLLDTKSGQFNGKIQIDSDLSNTSYIELVPYTGADTLYKEIDGICEDLLITTGEGEREKIEISRKPTKEEINNGYALDKVNYYLNIDKNKEFLSIDDLIGYEIDVNSKDKVIIKNINVNDKDTKITMQVKGNYEYLSQLVIFDEDMNDVKGWEGHVGAVLENEKEKIYSITLDKIDESKKYKIAIPQTREIDTKEKIRIDLK